MGMHLSAPTTSVDLVLSSICPGSLNAVGGVTDTPSVYPGIADGTTSMLKGKCALGPFLKYFGD
jgi:hypothetical protein